MQLIDRLTLADVSPVQIIDSFEIIIFLVLVVTPALKLTFSLIAVFNVEDKLNLVVLITRSSNM